MILIGYENPIVHVTWSVALAEGLRKKTYQSETNVVAPESKLIETIDPADEVKNNSNLLR